MSDAATKSIEAEVAVFKTTECYKQLAAIAREWGEGDASNAKNVQYKDKIEDVSRDEGYLNSMSLSWKQIGATPFNRGNEGLVWNRAHTRVLRVKRSGYSHSIFKQNAYALEDCPLTHEFAKYTAKVTSSDPHYATYREEEVTVATLGATHFSHGMACGAQGVPCDIEEISTNGRMDRDKICKGDPMMLQAMSAKPSFEVFKWVVHAALPSITAIFSNALNEMSTVAEGIAFG